jgi:hypothetical protein
MCDVKGRGQGREDEAQAHRSTRRPDLRAAARNHGYVDPEEDPANDPAAEYDRLADKYGMDKDLPMPCVDARLRRIQLRQLRGEAEGARRGPGEAGLPEGDRRGPDKAPPRCRWGAARGAEGARHQVEGDRGQGRARRRSSRARSRRPKRWRASTGRWGAARGDAGDAGAAAPVLLPARTHAHRHAPAQRSDAPVLDPRLGAPAPLRTEELGCTRRCSTTRPSIRRCNPDRIKG